MSEVVAHAFRTVVIFYNKRAFIANRSWRVVGSVSFPLGVTFVTCKLHDKNEIELTGRDSFAKAINEDLNGRVQHVLERLILLIWEGMADAVEEMVLTSIEVLLDFTWAIVEGVELVKVFRILVGIAQFPNKSR